MQSSLFPWLAEELGPLTAKQQEWGGTLEMLHIEEFIYSSRSFPGRPAQDRTAIARAFVPKGHKWRKGFITCQRTRAAGSARNRHSLKTDMRLGA
jgi:hypothetical protein